jgi:hypothetical protein
MWCHNTKKTYSEDCCFLGYEITYFEGSVLAFQRILLPPPPRQMTDTDARSSRINDLHL